MPIEEMMRGVLSMEQLKVAREAFNEVCAEYQIASDNTAVRFRIAEAIIATVQRSPSHQQVVEAAREAAARPIRG